MLNIRFELAIKLYKLVKSYYLRPSLSQERLLETGAVYGVRFIKAVVSWIRFTGVRLTRGSIIEEKAVILRVPCISMKP